MFGEILILFVLAIVGSIGITLIVAIFDNGNGGEG